MVSLFLAWKDVYHKKALPVVYCTCLRIAHLQQKWIDGSPSKLKLPSTHLCACHSIPSLNSFRSFQRQKVTFIPVDARRAAASFVTLTVVCAGPFPVPNCCFPTSISSCSDMCGWVISHAKIFDNNPGHYLPYFMKHTSSNFLFSCHSAIIISQSVSHTSDCKDSFTALKCISLLFQDTNTTLIAVPLKLACCF